MSEQIIEALLRLFAIITDRDEERVSGSGKSLVNFYLGEYFNSELVEHYLGLYSQYIEYYHSEQKHTLVRDDGSIRFFNREFVKEICNLINQENDLHGKYLILIQLFEFIRKDEVLTEGELQFVDYVASKLHLDESCYQDLKAFCLSSIDNIRDKNQLLSITGSKDPLRPGIKHFYNENQQVEIWIYRLLPINMLVFNYSGPRNLYMNGHKVAQNRVTVFSTGGVLRTSRIRPIYFSKVVSLFIQDQTDNKIVFSAVDIEYKFSRRHWGVHRFSFWEESGHLVGIMGGSGVGKSTLLNVLNGKLKIQQGKITINGFDLHRDREELKGVIGFVPQDDLLIEDLTVYQNLYYNARLCFAGLPEDDIREKIQQALEDFELEEARNLVVGTPLNKTISGGQRKRLNIALELVREPSILIVDEPTSGLSSMDSEKVMNLLKRQTFKGKLVIINIHQPSSDLYKMLDRLIIMDTGGYIVFNGNPMDAITYFKRQANYVNPEESECMTCGNVKTEQPLRIIEARVLNPNGKVTRKRKVSPREWHEMYKKNIEEKEKPSCERAQQTRAKIPGNFFRIPRRWEQLRVFVARDLFSKLKNRQYLAIALLEAPLLALVIGYFTKYMVGTETDSLAYIFSENVNIPSYLFMCVVVALFVGLIQSADEIFRDRKILERERFLNLSRTSYLTSKLVVLFSLSAIQTLSFVLIGNHVLEIHGLTLSYWMILFSTACFANALGLNLSAGLSSAVAIYILIPLLLIPQLLFSGVVVAFNKLPPKVNSFKYTPFIGDVMTSRWAYEALAVNQFVNNAYYKDIFPAELAKQQDAYRLYYYLPMLEERLQRLTRNGLADPGRTNILTLLENETRNLNAIQGKQASFEPTSRIWHLDSDSLTRKEFMDFLQESKSLYRHKYQVSSAARDSITSVLVRKAGNEEALFRQRQNYHNKALADQLEGIQELQKTRIVNHEIVQMDKPIYHVPGHPYGRAHFYAPYKRFLTCLVPTVWFNTVVIWFFTACLLLALYFDLLRKIIRYFEKFALRKRLVRQLRNVGINMDMNRPLD